MLGVNDDGFGRPFWFDQIVAERVRKSRKLLSDFDLSTDAGAMSNSVSEAETVIENGKMFSQPTATHDSGKDSSSIEARQRDGNNYAEPYSMLRKPVAKRLGNGNFEL